MANYAHPEMLVDTNWVKANLGKPGVKVVEIDVDTSASAAGFPITKPAPTNRKASDTER